MSKNKKKFKKFSKAQIIEQINKTENIHNVQPNNLKTESTQPQKNAPQGVSTNISTTENVYLKKDLKRVVWVLAIVLAILIALIYINNTTTWLSGFADDLMKILNVK